MGQLTIEVQIFLINTISENYEWFSKHKIKDAKSEHTYWLRLGTPLRKIS